MSALSTTGYVEQWLYYYATPNSAASGVAIAKLTTYANGTTMISAPTAMEDTTPPTGTVSVNAGGGYTNEGGGDVDAELYG